MKTFQEELSEILKRAWLKTVPPVGMDDVIWKGYIKGVTGSQAVFITSLVERLIGDDEPCVAEIDYPELGKLTINTKPMWKSAERNELRASILAKLKESKEVNE